MIADGNIKTYYLHFKSSAEKSKVEYKERLEEILLVKEELRDYLIKNKDNLFNAYSIDLNSFEDWVNNYPRQVLGFATSKELFDEQLLSVA